MSKSLNHAQKFFALRILGKVERSWFFAGFSTDDSARRDFFQYTSKLIENVIESGNDERRFKLGSIKRTILQIWPSFPQKALGFKTFWKLIRHLDKKGYIQYTLDSNHASLLPKSTSRSTRTPANQPNPQRTADATAEIRQHADSRN